MKMKRASLLPLLALALLLTGACRSHYRVAEVSRTRLLVDTRYDVTGETPATRFLAPYRHAVDSMMSPVVGSVAHDMAAQRPESDLSNLLADILVWGAERMGERPQMAVYNMGGIRAALSRGAVTYGDVVDIAPFENKLCVLTLTGDKLLELCSQMASTGGEGVSAAVRLRIGKDGRLLSARIGGKEIEPSASYRVATLDYLAQGNDGMVAFRDKTDVRCPQTRENNVRFIIMDYLRAHPGTDAQVEGRVVVE